MQVVGLRQQFNLDLKTLKIHLLYSYSNTHALNEKYCTKLKFRLWNLYIFIFLKFGTHSGST